MVRPSSAPCNSIFTPICACNAFFLCPIHTGCELLQVLMTAPVSLAQAINNYSFISGGPKLNFWCLPRWRSSYIHIVIFLQPSYHKPLCHVPGTCPLFHDCQKPLQPKNLLVHVMGQILSGLAQLGSKKIDLCIFCSRNSGNQGNLLWVKPIDKVVGYILLLL